MASRAGSVLTIILAVLFVVGLLGATLVDRSLRSRVTAAWGRDHMVARALAESAAEELYVIMQREANVPGSALYTLLRRPPAGTPSFDLPCPAFKNLTVDLERSGRELGATVRVSCAASIRKLTGTPVDTVERTGVAAFDATIFVERPRAPAVIERLRVERQFRLMRIALPQPLDQLGLYIRHVAPAVLPRYRGRAAFARAEGKPISLFDVVTTAGAQALRAVKPKDKARIDVMLKRFSPVAMFRRAAFIAADQRELDRLMIAASRTHDGAISGVIHVTNIDPIVLELPKFRGRAVLSFAGGVVVKDVTMDDLTRDCLTIVSPSIAVHGREVQANLVVPPAAGGGLSFSAKAAVRGCLVANEFPVGIGLSGPELAQVTLQSNPPPQTQRHFASFAPYATSVQHARDRAEWVVW